MSPQQHRRKHHHSSRRKEPKTQPRDEPEIPEYDPQYTYPEVPNQNTAADQFFTVQIRYPNLVYSAGSTVYNTGRNCSASQVPYGRTTLLEVQIVLVQICNTVAALKGQVFIGDGWYYGSEEFKSGKSCWDNSVFWVEWEPDSRGQQTWTRIHDWNVNQVLKRLKTRETCSDILVLNIPTTGK